MGEDEAFLAAIRARPADGTTRLVYADWLDERGDLRGDFLRLECRLYGMPGAAPECQSLRRQLGELARPLDGRWVAAVCRVRVEFGGTAISPVAWADPLSAWTATAGGVTMTGDYRESNEDLLLFDPAHPIAVVLDGMGTYPVDERAATVGGGFLGRELAGAPAAGESTEAYIRRSLRAANDAVLALRRLPGHIGNVTTAVLAVLRAGRVFVSWAGDSMAYRMSRDNVEPLTWQHDFRTMFCRQHGLSVEEARHYRWKNGLVHFLGGTLPDPIEVPSFTPEPGDRLILATDGVYCCTEPAEILAACRLHPNALACAEHLVRCALDRGSRDNATCVVIAFDSPPRGESEPRAGGGWWRFWSKGGRRTRRCT